MRKSTLVWLLTSKKFKLSGDRTVRVKCAEETLRSGFVPRAAEPVHGVVQTYGVAYGMAPPTFVTT